MKIFIITTALFVFLIQSCSENRATDLSEGNHTATVELSSTALFSGSENEITPLQLWNKQTSNQSASSLAKIAAKISFKHAYVISLNYDPYIKDYLTYNNDSTMNCLFLNSNSAAFTNRPLDNWDTLSAALHDFSMCTVNDIKPLEKDGDDFVNGYVKVNPGINWIIAAFIDQSDKISYTSVARYVYMDPILDIYRPNGVIWTNGFIASSADDIWKSAPLRKILYSGKDSCYNTFSAYNIAGFTIAGISPEYASYSCLHPDSVLTTGNGTPPITGGQPSWKKIDSLTATGDSPSILFRTVTDSFPYIAFIDSLKGNSVRILRKSNTGFDSIGTTPLNATSYAIAASNDTIYLAFRDNTQSNRITIWKYNGTNWSVIATGAGSGAASAISISFTAIGKPCIAFSDGSRNGKLSLLTYSTTTSSFAVDTTIPLTQAVTATAIAVSNDSRIYTAAITASGKMHIFNSDSLRWIKTDSLFTASTGTISILSIRASNEIQLAYVDKSSGGYAFFKRKLMNESAFTDAASPIESGDALSFAGSLNPSATNTFFSFCDRLNGSKGTVLYSGGTGDSWRPLEKSGFTESAVSSITVAVSGKEVPWLLTKENNRLNLYRHGL